MFKVITIMADFGMGPYAWGKNIQDIDDSRVGGNIADSVSGFEPAYGVPGKLQDRLGAWVAHFEKCADQPGFNWEEFNTEGIKLSKALKDALGEAFIVFYDKPMEDPTWQTEGRVRI